MKRFILPFLFASLMLPRAASGAEGFVYFEGTAATVNREVLFFSDILFEQCMLRCGAPEGPGREYSLSEIRQRLIVEMLALQEQEKLALAPADNVMLAEHIRKAGEKLESCESPCRHDVSVERLARWAEQKLVVKDFLHNRVGVFVDISEEEVRRELERREAQGESASGLSDEETSRQIREDKVGKEVQNWYTRASSKAAITLSPLEEK